MVNIKPIRLFMPTQKYSNTILYPLIDSEAISKKYLQYLHPRNYIYVDYPQFQTNQEFDKQQYFRNSYLNLKILKDNNYILKNKAPSIYLIKQSYNFKFYFSFTIDLDVNEYENGNIYTSEKCIDSKMNFLTEKLENFKHSINPTSMSCKFSDILKLIIWEISNNSSSIIRTFVEKDSIEVFKLSEEYSSLVVNEFKKIKKLYLLDGHHRLFSFYNFVLKKRREIREKEILKDSLCDNYDHLLCNIIDESNFEINNFNKLIKTDMSYEKILSDSQKYFNVEKLNYFRKPINNQEFLIYFKDCWYSYKLKEEFKNKELGIKNIYVFTLEEYFFKEILQMKDLTKVKTISYKIGKEAFFENLEEKVNNKEFKLAIYNNPIEKEEFKSICINKQLTPPKSILIYPKPIIGMFTKQVIN